MTESRLQFGGLIAGDLDRGFALAGARDVVGALHHVEIVAEGLRADMKGVIDTTTATGEKVDRLIESNAIEHAAFLDALTDHEVRITRLEAAPGTSQPTTS